MNALALATRTGHTPQTAPPSADTIGLEMSAALTRPPPDEARLARRAKVFRGLVEDMAIDTQGDYELAADELRSLKQAWAEMEADRTSFTGPLNAVLDKINARFQPYLKMLKEAEGVIKGKMGAFLQIQQRKVDADRAAADAAAAAERAQIEAQAAALRTAAEAAGPEARAAAEAQAEALEQAAAVVIAQPAPRGRTGAAGIVASATATFELVSMIELVQHIANKRPDLIVLLKLDETKVRAMVKMMGLNTALPGIRVFEKTGLTVR